MAIVIERVGTTQDRLGESPVWSARDGLLYWVDSLAGILHRLDPATGLRADFAVPAPVGSFALCHDGGAILALRDGFFRYDFAARTCSPIAAIGVEHPDLRLNDGKVDRQGRFVAGTMHMNLPPGEAPLGGLYRLARDGRVTQLAADIVTANGPCFSPDGRILYLADSPRQVIWRFDYGDQATGRRVFADLAPLGTAPDGATVDAEGHLWTALVRSGEVARFDPTGRLVLRLRMPVTYPTSLSFGGPALDVLYVTSISKSHRLTAPEPEAGGLFAITGLGVTGIAEPLAAA
ncbi:SMP-30/gluconolactonase/LRE family protein [Humitalea sp. 24SJ18S-53]|uniref:SMP-30/gluconolactonase/LRE family protein n=1 Tax=Humitalea sp. 24SJ18S-53 TaxID=3422307 RepID=UPI003D67E729